MSRSRTRSGYSYRMLKPIKISQGRRAARTGHPGAGWTDQPLATCTRRPTPDSGLRTTRARDTYSTVLRVLSCTDSAVRSQHTLSSTSAARPMHCITGRAPAPYLYAEGFALRIRASGVVWVLRPGSSSPHVHMIDCVVLAAEVESKRPLGVPIQPLIGRAAGAMATLA